MHTIPYPWSALISILDNGRFPLAEGIDFVLQQDNTKCEELLHHLCNYTFTSVLGETKRFQISQSI